MTMAIQALPQTTVRTLGASQVLNDPAAVIKELVDNALDARATSVAVEISKNALDSIQVRDNGHGIPPEDRHLVARPHCTSKIGSEDDLIGIGGSSLGFRGEALSSVAEMSGSLTFSTRVEGEQVATGLKINQQGEVVGQDRASLPVGTTVRIAEFLKKHPVRRQVVLKGTEKILQKVKETLQSYAFARPFVRFSLRVTKAKNDKGNWTYAPQPGGNAENAAFKIVGAACASQCTWSVIEDHGFTLQALVPKPDADAGKVSSIGSFLSVDHRPMSTSRGTPNQIVKIFREALKKSNTALREMKDPFMYMEISCPPASYDANVEPAKDDVLFENPDALVGAARRLFETLYPQQTIAAPQEPVKKPNHARNAPPQILQEEDDFVTSLEAPFLPSSSSLLPDQVPTERAELMQPQSHEMHDPDTPHISFDSRGAFRHNMYGCDEEDLHLVDARPTTGRTEADFEELRQARKDVNVSNPWVLAKLNASVRQPAAMEWNDKAGSTNAFEYGDSPSRSQKPIDLEAAALPTPRASSPTTGTRTFHPSDHVPDVQFARDGRLIGSQSLPPPHMIMGPTPSSDFDANREPPDNRVRQAPEYNYGQSSQSMDAPNGTPLDAIPQANKNPRRNAEKQPRQTQVNTPFVPPVRGREPREKVWFDHLEDDYEQSRPAKRRQRQPRDSAGLVAQGELGESFDEPRPLSPPRRNRDMRDFVTNDDLTGNDTAFSLIGSRNYPRREPRPDGANDRRPTDQEDSTARTSAILGGGSFIPASELAAVEAHFGGLKGKESQSTKRRKTNESRVLREVSGNATNTVETNQSAEDERAPSRRRRTTDGGKVPRTKSSRLPLERTPAGQGTQNVVFNVSTTAGEVSKLAGHINEEFPLPPWNEPALGSYDTFATTHSQEETEELARRLHEFLIDRVSDGEMVQDLSELVQMAFTAHGKSMTEMVEV